MKSTYLFIAVLLLSCIGAKPPFDLQAEIEHALPGATVQVPCGVHDIGDVVIKSTYPPAETWQKVVTIQGCGHAHLGQSPPQGHSQWEYLLDRGYYYGTVLRGTITIEKGTGTPPKVYFRDVSFIGYGTGTAVRYGDGVNMYPEGGFDSVSFGNYDTGILLDMAYYITVNDVSMAGVGIGLDIKQSNANTVSGLNVTTCNTGVRSTGNGNSFTGGSVQVCGVGFDLGGSSSILGGFYFEQNDISLIVSGNANTVLSNYYAGNGGEILVSGVGNDIFAADTSGPIDITGWRNRVDLSRDSTVCINDTWPTLNKCEVLHDSPAP